jgi:hypothetical protein
MGDSTINMTKIQAVLLPKSMAVQPPGTNDIVITQPVKHIKIF